MRFALVVGFGLFSCSALVAAQTYTDCNPLQKTCPADPAFGKADQTFDFTKGSSSDFTPSGNVAYDGTNGASFTIRQQGDGPLIQSNWYIMFGKVEFTIKAAPGTGIVSSAVLQSDDLDEIDWEWLGGNDNQVQTNYFGKGDTSTYNRGAYSSNPGNHDGFHTYSVDWTSSQIVWAIDGQTVRVLTPETADSNQYPQTPMMIKVGIWAGGDPNNSKGTIDWAGGETDYSKGPYVMYLKSMSVTDYSTGSSYKYSDKTGSWKSITAEGGNVNGNSAEEPKSVESAPAVTATIDSIPIPWSGTHKQTSSWVTPNVWPWVATDSPAASSTGLPSGWESSSGQIHPPTGGSVSERSPEPTITSINSIAKTESSSPQSTIPSTSRPLVSSSAAFSPSGLDTGRMSVTRIANHTHTHSTSTRSKTIYDWWADGEADTSVVSSTAAATAGSSSHIAPSVGSGVSVFGFSVVLSAFCALVSGAVIFL